MVTVSHIVKKIVNEQPFVEEGLGIGIISVQGLAEQMQPKIEQELGKKIKLPAIIMAIRRHSEEIKVHRNTLQALKYGGEIIVRSNICDFAAVKSNTLLAKLRTIHNLVNFERGDSLNVIVGSNEVSIVISEKYSEKLAKFLGGEKIIGKEKGLVSMTIIFISYDFFHTPGIVFDAVRRLAWNSINIYEIVSTMTELTFILHKKDSMKAYEVLQEIVGK